jgi:cadmium resistance protein CadD (predicted permease)
MENRFLQDKIEKYGHILLPLVLITLGLLILAGGIVEAM